MEEWNLVWYEMGGHAILDIQGSWGGGIWREEGPEERYAQRTNVNYLFVFTQSIL